MTAETKNYMLLHIRKPDFIETALRARYSSATAVAHG